MARLEVEAAAANHALHTNETRHLADGFPALRKGKACSLHPDSGYGRRLKGFLDASNHSSQSSEDLPKAGQRYRLHLRKSFFQSLLRSIQGGLERPKGLHISGPLTLSLSPDHLQRHSRATCSNLRRPLAFL